MIFTIDWIAGSVNDCIIKYCDQHGIDWQYNHFGKLELNINGIWMVPCATVKDDVIVVIA